MPRRPKHRSLPIAVLAIGMALQPACRNAVDGAGDPAPERASGADAGLSEDAGGRTDLANAQAAAGAGGGGNVPIPSDFPRDVHLPASIHVERAMDMAGLKMVNLTTPSTMAQVSADVENGMQALGWTREIAIQEGGGSTLVYSKDRRQTVYQLVRRGTGGTRLAIRTGAGG